MINECNHLFGDWVDGRKRCVTCGLLTASDKFVSVVEAISIGWGSKRAALAEKLGTDRYDLDLTFDDVEAAVESTMDDIPNNPLSVMVGALAPVVFAAWKLDIGMSDVHGLLDEVYGAIMERIPEEGR